MRKILAPQLNERAIERYVKDALGAAHTPALRATCTISHRGQTYVLIRRPNGKMLAIYREDRHNQLRLVTRPPEALLGWACQEKVDPKALLSG